MNVKWTKPTLALYVFRKINLVLKSDFKGLLSQIYGNPNHPAGLSTPAKLYTAVKHQGVTRKTVESFLQSQDSYTKHKKANYKYPRRQITSPCLNNLFQADLMSLEKIHRQNSHVKYHLVVIDILSRYLYVVPLKSKKSTEVAAALESVFQKNVCKRLQTDRGSEFYSAAVKSLLKKYNVTLFSTYSNTKAAAVEKAIATLKYRIAKYLTHNGTKRYLDALPDIVNSYNHTKHSRTKFKPAEVGPMQQLTCWHNSFDKGFVNRKQKIRYKIGDFVRILINKGVFEKGSTQTFSNTVYEVIEILNTIPVMYKLKDNAGEVLGSFYNQELSKVKNS